jgi:glycosyltransferase involved in cell wall biosynthesis
MACVLKVPQPGSAGVVTFTTAERDQAINADESTRAAIAALKPRWIIGLHHNWHDHAFRYDPLFDFSMAGEEDLIEVDGTEVPLVTLDACNFVPDCFEPGHGEPFWDLLYIARPVFFKGFGQFLDAVRELYDGGHRLRVLCIAPVPPPSLTDETVTDVRARYDKLFSPAEQDLFNLLTLDFRYPFPFDLPTLAHFYRSSRAFVHFAPDERRCRVAAYAWATGIPVIGMEPVGSLLPPPLRRTPFFHRVDRYEQFPDRILEALEATSVEADFGPARREVTPPETIQRLFSRLHELTDRVAPTVPTTGGAFEGLDIRLGRHHGLASGTNAVAMKVGELASVLAGDEPRVAEAVRLTSDPEVALSAETAPVAPAVALPRRRRGLFRRAR